VSKSSQTLAKLRDLPSDELAAALGSSRDELFRLRLGMQTNQVTSTASVLNKRRDVARVLTLMRARKLGLEGQGASAKPSANQTADVPSKAPKAAATSKTPKPASKTKAKKAAE
jgi:ribosomal protein L29